MRAPLENTFVTIAAQSECPLLIEEAQLLLNVEHSWDFMFKLKLRNRGDKLIRRARLHFWTSDGSGGSLQTPFDHCGPLPAGATFDKCVQIPEITILPLDPNLRGRLHLGLPMKQIVVLYVEVN